MVNEALYVVPLGAAAAEELEVRALDVVVFRVVVLLVAGVVALKFCAD